MSTQAGADQPPTDPAPTSGEIGEHNQNDLDPTAAALAHRLVETTRMAARLEIRIEWLEHQLRQLREARGALDSGIEEVEASLREIRSEGNRLRSLARPISVDNTDARESEDQASVFPAPSSPESEFLRERQADAPEQQGRGARARRATARWLPNDEKS